MKSDLIKIIQKVSLETINEHALKVMFGKVESVAPLKIKIGDTWTLTEECIVLDTPVDDGEDVIVIKYSVGNKYLVLSTIEKVYNHTPNTGGIVDS